MKPYPFYKIEIFRYDYDNLSSTVDKKENHTYYNMVIIDFRDFSATKDINFDLVPKR